MSPRRSSLPSTVAISNELGGLLSRYCDLVSAQYDALQHGAVRKAVMLSKSAERVLADAHRADRRLTAARTLDPPTPDAWETIRNQLQTTRSQVQGTLARLGSLLTDERARMLNEFKQLDPHGADHQPGRPWSVPPTRLNIRT